MSYSRCRDTFPPTLDQAQVRARECEIEEFPWLLSCGRFICSRCYLRPFGIVLAVAEEDYGGDG